MTKLPRKKPGTAPGSLIHVGHQKVQKAKLSLIEYSSETFKETEVTSLAEVQIDPNHITWLNLDGLHETDLIADIGLKFSIHPLVLEDCLNVHQRPKIDQYDEYIYIVMRMLTYGNEAVPANEQISLILGRNFIITFQERPSSIFHQLIDRLRNAKGRLRKQPADYLLYHLLDVIVDNYFLVLDGVSELVEKYDQAVLHGLQADDYNELHRQKRSLVALRKWIAPSREVINTILKDDADLISEQMMIYFNDLQDHIIQVVDLLDVQREILNDISNVHISLLTQRTNEVMKILTMITSIFVPLTFVVGVYGMNFHNMPELTWTYGYQGTWLLMLVIALIMLIYFRQQKWLD